MAKIFVFLTTFMFLGIAAVLGNKSALAVEASDSQKPAHPTTHGAFGPFKRVDLFLYEEHRMVSGGKIEVIQKGQKKQYEIPVDLDEISTSIAMKTSAKVLATAFLPIRKENLMLVLVEAEGSGPADDQGERSLEGGFITFVYRWSDGKVQLDAELSEELSGAKTIAEIRKKLLVKPKLINPASNQKKH